MSVVTSTLVDAFGDINGVFVTRSDQIGSIDAAALDCFLFQ